MAARHPSREDRALWRNAMKGVARVAPARPAPAAADVEPPTEPPRVRRSRATPPQPKTAPALPRLEPGSSPGVDRRTAEKLRKGKLGVEARLDLHGLMQDEAHRALDRFVVRAHEQGLRTVLVITGKGGVGGARGVLKEAVPRWLNEAPLRPRVLSCSWAQPKDGGAGALYVLLRRQR
jgi:DNA-nicking Smr family endonuclease